LLENFRRHRVRVATSFYTATESVHDHITGGTGSHKRTLAGIQSVLAAGWRCCRNRP
jgi:hypothetical protein